MELSKNAMIFLESIIEESYNRSDDKNIATLAGAGVGAVSSPFPIMAALMSDNLNTPVGDALKYTALGLPIAGAIIGRLKHNLKDKNRLNKVKKLRAMYRRRRARQRK
jgi:hypothetical protein